ncbi:MAG TPA: (2Fe-2S) ferredoxin domain-containing protein, partial [Polyangiaceae bacterium]|nr:(2Fe-2S) ferredoxin domain-containing protein [Polyangiaceae bacterium]
MALRKRYLFVCINRRPEGNPKGSCAARGSERVHGALKKALGEADLAKVEARACTSSCLDVCSQGVTILVEPDHVFLGGVTEADVP